jgi:predicted MFS family arabinose efflux permease
MAIVMPVVLLERLHVGPAVVGIAWGVSAASQFVGALVMGRLESGPRDRVLIAGSFLAYGAALGLFLAPPSVPLVLLAMVATGALNAPAGVTMFTMRQRRTDPAWTGRAFAISMSLSFAGYPLGSAIAGAFAEQSVAGPILFGMATCVLAGLLALWLIPAHGPEFGTASAVVAHRDAEPVGEHPRA